MVKAPFFLFLFIPLLTPSLSIDAWKMATFLQQQNIWDALTNRALDVLDIDLAIMVYRYLKNAAMVQALEKVRHIDERNYLSGKVSLLLGDYSRAQEYFLKSSNHLAALEMRRDLMHWDQVFTLLLLFFKFLFFLTTSRDDTQALRLAESMAPEQVPDICQEYAQQLEFRGLAAASTLIVLPHTQLLFTCCR